MNPKGDAAMPSDEYLSDMYAERERERHQELSGAATELFAKSLRLLSNEDLRRLCDLLRNDATLGHTLRAISILSKEYR